MKTLKNWNKPNITAITIRSAENATKAGKDGGGVKHTLS